MDGIDYLLLESFVNYRNNDTALNVDDQKVIK